MNKVSLKIAKQNEMCRANAVARSENFLMKSLAADKRAEDKNKRETVSFFVSEIERCKVQIDRLSRTGELGDAMRCKHYQNIIAEKTMQMEAKFSEEEIAKARLIFASKPNPFIFDDNQR